MNSKLLAGVALAALIAGGLAHAQDPALPPAYGSVRLSSGFEPDPASVGVRAGGAIYAGNASDYCSGYITPQASYAFDYDAANREIVKAF